MREERCVEAILGQMLEGISQSSGAAGHLIHQRQDSRWFHIRDILEATRLMISADAVEPLLETKK